MRKFDSFFLMNTDDVRRYAVEVLHRFDADEETECREIGDGNINYVFQVRSLRDGHSVIVKQADRLLRSSGRRHLHGGYLGLPQSPPRTDGGPVLSAPE